MPKQKFNSVDVAAEVAELRRLVVGSWLANIYDLDDKKTFLLKFTKSGGRTESGEGEKTVLLLESGSRFHTTSYVRERKADAPSKLNAKLRMHLKGKRLNAVCQLGRDRVVEFVFGTGDTKHSLVLELYAQGNLVLLDKNDLILTLLRPVRDDDAGLVMLGNHLYDRKRFRARNSLREVSVFDVETALATGDVCRRVDEVTEHTGVEENDVEVKRTTTDGEGDDDGVARSADAADTADTAASKKISKDVEKASSRSPRTLREALCRAFGFSPQTADWVAAKAGAKDGGITKLPLSFSGDTNAENARLVENVANALGELQDWLDGVADGSIQNIEGHAEETFLFESVLPEDAEILAVDAENSAAQNKGAWVSESFSPFPFVASGEDDFDASSLNAPNENRDARVRRLLDPRGFDALVDAHFASIERLADQRARTRALLNANKKADKVKKDQERRANDLRREERLQETRATLIEYNLSKVDAVIAAVNSLLASGQSWVEIERFVEDEKKHGNPVAGLVKHLDLKNNAVTVGLTNRLDDESRYEDVSLETDDATNDSPGGETTSESPRRKREKKPSVAVTLDLSLSAYANAREHFDKKKRHAAKLTKTENQSGRALESARRDSEQRVKKSQTQKKIGVGSVSLARTPEWFEKFHWFITPENCLVLSARDASQTNLLVKKYMGPHDAFVRADVAKAPATIVKAPYSAVLRHYEEKEEEKEGKNGSGTQKKKCLVPSLSLAHAGAACLCRSSAWDTRTVISAWWVPSGAVRLVAENGDALAPGVVWHVGRKRYLPPAPMVMGYAYAFLVKSEDDVKRHAADRTTRVLGETDDRFHEEEDGEETEEPEENNKGPRRLSEETRRPASSALDAFLDGSVETTRARAPVAEEHADPPARCDRDGEEADKAEEAPEASEKNSARGGKARVSAAERRAMKKAMKKGANGSLDSNSNSNSIDGVSHELDRVRPGRPQKDDELEPKQKPPKNAAANKNASDKKQKTLPRGKSAKARRAAARYAEQDDEDRALAMALLGVKMKDDSKARTDDDDDDETNTVSRTSAQSDDDAATTTETTTFSTRAKGDDVDDEEDGVGVHSNSFDSDSEDSSEDGQETVSFLERDLARVARVDWFTGAPFLETEVTHAVAFVAPWDALKAFAYKAKLTPGSQKKGKAAKQALEVVTRAPPAADVMKSFSKEEKTVEDVSKPESRREKAARAERDSALKATIAAAAAAAAAGDGAMLMCGQGLKVSMPAGAAKAMNAAKKNSSGKRG
jgi:predicted ribosome quality control (RQC) complex YloA/Tae2 family protein